MRIRLQVSCAPELPHGDAFGLAIHRRVQVRPVERIHHRDDVRPALGIDRSQPCDATIRDECAFPLRHDTEYSNLQLLSR